MSGDPKSLAGLGQNKEPPPPHTFIKPWVSLLSELTGGHFPLTPDISRGVAMNALLCFVFLYPFLLLLPLSSEPQQLDFWKTEPIFSNTVPPALSTSGSSAPFPRTGDTWGIQMMKQGWCAGHVQTMRNMTTFWQIQAVKTVALLNGEMNPSVEELTHLMTKALDFSCTPRAAKDPQLLRVVVKWLRDHPETVHEGCVAQRVSMSWRKRRAFNSEIILAAHHL